MIDQSELPTLADLHSVLETLISEGHGDLKLQVVAVPITTVQSLAADTMARYEQTDGVPQSAEQAAMIEFALPGKKLGIAFAAPSAMMAAKAG